MVPGLGSFREKFKNYTDYYTIIGGTACDILLSEADLPFRATKDIDMILIMEDNFPEFASIFWEYIKEGSYKCGWKNEENMHFYRFTEGKFRYPTMIELFSRNPGYHLEIEEGIVPIHVDDDTSSLSAILLNDDFYKFMMAGRRVVDGIGVLGAEHLIPFKMYAWVNLLNRKRAGEHVNEKDLKKHKYDPKQLHHLVRVSDYLDRYIAGESYESCLDPGPMKQELIEIKEGKYSLAEARVIADKTKAHVEEMAEYAYSIYPNEEDPQVNALLDDVQYEIMKIAVERELS